MRTKIVEVTDKDRFNFGKFMVAEFDSMEWARECRIDAEAGGMRVRLLERCGWTFRRSTLVLDLQTGEGSIFSPGGVPKADLEKHKVWVCLLFEPFLEWLYEKWSQERRLDLEALPEMLVLPIPAQGLYGHRRAGPTDGDLAAENRRLREALAGLESLHAREGESTPEAWERIAEAFYKATGFLRPGKCEPDEWYTADREKKRDAAWEKWRLQAVVTAREILGLRPKEGKRDDES